MDFPQRRVHYVQYQYFFYFTFYLFGGGLRTHPTHPPAYGPGSYRTSIASRTVPRGKPAPTWQTSRPVVSSGVKLGVSPELWTQHAEDWYLRLRESESAGEFGSLGQRQVLRALEAGAQLIELVAGEDGARFAHLAVTWRRLGRLGIVPWRRWHFTHTTHTTASTQMCLMRNTGTGSDKNTQERTVLHDVEFHSRLCV